MSENPCKVCEAPTPFPDSIIGQVECTNCWEVEKRLTAYLKSENGRRFALNLLLSDHMAHAILNMDNHGHSTKEQQDEWNVLVVAAEKQTGLLSDKHYSDKRYKGDRITKDGERYGKQAYIPKQIILTRREDNDTIWRMVWVGRSSPEDEQAAREYATEDGWMMHCHVVDDGGAAWNTCRERHAEIEAGQKNLTPAIRDVYLK